MPLYDYRCVDCGERDQIIGGLDDHTAFCSNCGGVMVRVTEDIFQGYFASETRRPQRAKSRKT